MPLRVTVVAVPWQTYRPVLQAVVDASAARGWTLTVRTELDAVPSWARFNYAPFDAAAPLPPTDLLVWLTEPPLLPVPPPALSTDVPWVVVARDDVPPAHRGRWMGCPSRGTWERTDGPLARRQQLLAVPDPAAFFQGLAAGRAAWPAHATWTGPALPGRQCPATWWSPGTWAVHDDVGVEYVGSG